MNQVIFLIIQLSSNLDQLYLVVWTVLISIKPVEFKEFFPLRGGRKNDLCKNMEWATDLVLKNLARTGITSRTSLQDSLVSFCVPFICLAFIKPIYQNVSSSRDFCTVDEIPSDCSTIKQYFYIGLLVFHLLGKWNVRSLLECLFCPSWEHNWRRPIFSLFNNFKLETCWLLICLLTIYFFEWKRRQIHINIHQNLQWHIKREKKITM